MTTAHVFVVASGFGKRVIPKTAPFAFGLKSVNTLEVRTGALCAVVEPGQSADDAGPGVVEVADVTDGPTWPGWWLETNLYRIPLPTDWTAFASGEVQPSVFDLVGPHNSIIFVQVPRRVPELDQMFTAGQQLIERGSFVSGDWAAFRYTEAGHPFIQRHAVVDIGNARAVITIQSRADTFALVAPTHRLLAEALRSGEH